MGHMSSSRQFAIMSLHAGLKDYHEVCTNYLSHSAISSIDCGKGSMYLRALIVINVYLNGPKSRNTRRTFNMDKADFIPPGTIALAPQEWNDRPRIINQDYTYISSIYSH